MEKRVVHISFLWSKCHFPTKSLRLGASSLGSEPSACDQKPTDNIRMATNGSAVLQHPFTCIVAGCTQSGKSVLVKSLLENAQKTISPPPQRIIWCYDQWQTSYFDMMRTMPGIEFNQGIPEDIDNADYLDGI